MSQQPPNVVLITCHDLGRFLGCYQVPTVRSPNLDALAADGIRFAQAFSTAPQCSPSRAALATGRYPHNNGVMGLAQPHFAWELLPEERHLGQVLHDAGYTTSLIGVNHIGGGEIARTDSLAEPTTRAELERVAERCGMDEVVGGGTGEVTTDRALERLSRFAAGSLPFYLQVGYTETHRLFPKVHDPFDCQGFLADHITPDDSLGVTVPSNVIDEPSAREEIAELQGSVRYVDSQIGRIFDRLRELGLEDNTLVIFTTDHGIAFPDAKSTLYDSGLGIALIMRLPAREWRGGRIYSELVSNVDVFPTVLDVAGVPVSMSIQGRSLAPLLDGRGFEPRDCIFAEMNYQNYYDPMRCIRTERYKLIVHFSTAPWFLGHHQQWRGRTRPIHPPPHSFCPCVELYDLERDPREFENRIDDPAYCNVRNDLLGRLRDWLHTTDDPILRGAITPPMHHWALDILESQ